MRFVLLNNGSGGWEIRDMWTMQTMGIYSSCKDAIPRLNELNEQQG